MKLIKAYNYLFNGLLSKENQGKTKKNLDLSLVFPSSSKFFLGLPCKSLSRGMRFNIRSEVGTCDSSSPSHGKRITAPDRPVRPWGLGP